MGDSRLILIRLLPPSLPFLLCRFPHQKTREKRERCRLDSLVARMSPNNSNNSIACPCFQACGFARWVST